MVISESENMEIVYELSHILATEALSGSDDPVLLFCVDQ